MPRQLTQSISRNAVVLPEPAEPVEGTILSPGITRIIKLEASTSEDQWELARLYAQECESASQREVADLVGKSQSHVKLMVRVATEYLGTQSLAFNEAYQLAKAPKKQAKAVKSGKPEVQPAPAEDNSAPDDDLHHHVDDGLVAELGEVAAKSSAVLDDGFYQVEKGVPYRVNMAPGDRFLVGDDYQLVPTGRRGLVHSGRTVQSRT